MAKHLNISLGHPVVIENVTGAAGGQQLNGMLKYTTGLKTLSLDSSGSPLVSVRASATLDQMRILLAGAWQAAFL